MKDAPNAFLRCDRGVHLYVTNAPALGGGAVPEEFLGERAGGLLYLTPEDVWIDAFTRWAEPRCAGNALYREFLRFERRAVDGASRALWLAGLKALELGAREAERENYERKVRQCAALSLRAREGGGALAACAACLAILRENDENEGSKAK